MGKHIERKEMEIKRERRGTQAKEGMTEKKESRRKTGNGTRDEKGLGKVGFKMRNKQKTDLVTVSTKA